MKVIKLNYKKFINQIFIALGALFLIALIFAYLNSAFEKPQVLTLSELVSKINNSEVSKIIINNDDLAVTLKDNNKYSVKKETESSLTETLKNYNVDSSKLGAIEIKIEQSVGFNFWVGTVLPLVLPFLLVGFLIWYMMRQASRANMGAFSFGKSQAKLSGPFDGRKKIMFSDVAGANEAKDELIEVVDFLKNSKKFLDMGARIPRGVLLVGAPGTGKTLLARAVAGEANVPFFYISGSEFVEMFVGVGASRVRDLFSMAKKFAPSIVFIDEIDAVGRRRGSGMGGGHDEREQTLNQILVEMDGFEQGVNVIVLAATNRSDVLDPALLRPGRFDRRVNIDLPDRKDRKLILETHFKEKPVSKDVDMDALAAKTAGSSGADLANIANEAAILAARNNRKVIENEDVVQAFEKVALGPERKSKIMSDKEKELTAYHEAGHAVVGHVLPDSDMVHKVTIIPRGATGGVTWFIPPEDKSYHSIIEFKDVLARMLGGRVAEELIYGPDRVTTGAGSDLQKAAELARDMIVNQGMGKQLRDQVFHVDEGMMLEKLVHERQYSDDTAKVIDNEVEALITEAGQRAREVLKVNMPKLEQLKVALLEKETVEAEEVIKLLEGTVMPKEAALY